MSSSDANRHMSESHPCAPSNTIHKIHSECLINPYPIINPRMPKDPLTATTYDNIQPGLYEKDPKDTALETLDFSNLAWNHDDESKATHRAGKGLMDSPNRAGVPDRTLSQSSHNRLLGKTFSTYSTKTMTSILADMPPRKPKAITDLESILSSACARPVRITRVKELPATRKQAVKEISYTTGDGAIWKVWVFKADPKQTIRELNAYHVAFNAGVPTGKPIGYTPMQADAQYPYDIAILGGAINYAGSSYHDLLCELQLAPDLAHKSACRVARMIADIHIKLTDAIDEFSRLGIALPKFSVSEEISSRFMKGSGCDPNGKYAKELIRIFTDLDSKGSDILVVSHNDIHTKNILSLAQNNAYGQIGSSYMDLGIIDWGEIAMDRPHGDLQDFWIHHKRAMDSICGGYRFNFIDLEKEYEDEYNFLGKQRGLFFDRENNRLCAKVKSAMWNLLEMYDPVRKDQKDIEDKATIHANALMQDLGRIAGFGYEKEAAQIRESLIGLLSDKAYMSTILRQ